MADRAKSRRRRAKSRSGEKYRNAGIRSGTGCTGPASATSGSTSEQLFQFEGGRLLLRGKNGAGKSKALELLLPFLLDGDVKRLDATGAGKTTFRWLMSEGATGVNRQGFLWLELRRGRGRRRPSI